MSLVASLMGRRLSRFLDYREFGIANGRGMKDPPADEFNILGLVEVGVSMARRTASRFRSLILPEA